MRKLYFYHELEDIFENHLNECYEPYKIGECIYHAGDILRSADPIAFRCEISDWVSACFKELSFSELTDEEIAFYLACESTVLYLELVR